MSTPAEILQLQEWSEAYYTGLPVVSDAEFDARVDELKKKYPNDPYWLTIGTSTRANLTKLPHKKGSLNKCHPNTIEEWLQSIRNIFKKDVVFLCTPKIDGLSIVLQYEGGKFIRAQTRGNGYEGQDVTSRFKYIVPQKISYKNKLEVDGECTCLLKDFKAFEGEFAMPRNFTVGTLRPSVKNTDFEKLIKEDVNLRTRLRSLTFLCFDVNFPDIKTKYERLKQAKKLGFKTVLKPTKKSIDWGTRTKFTEEWFKKACKLAEDKIGVMCDGVVVEINRVSYAQKLGYEANGLNPKGSRAVKLLPKDQKSEVATVKNVEWNLSKTGVFVPRVNLKPVVIKGAEFNWVNGISLKYIEKFSIGKGSKIKLIRSGDVIPRVMGSVRDSDVEYPKVCPHCGTKTRVVETFDKKGNLTNKTLICPNKTCSGLKANKVVSYFTQLGIDDVAGATITQLYKEGFNTVKKIYKIKKEDLLKLEGFQDSKAKKVLQGLKSARNVSLALFMQASGYFNSNNSSLGKTRLQMFIDYYGIEKILSGKIKLNKMPNIPTIKQKLWDLFVLGYNEWYNFYSKLKKIVKFFDFEKPDLDSNKLKGMVFCMTGFRDKDLMEVIRNNGGVYKDNLTKQTTHLFAAKDSNKTKKAEKDGIKIIPAGEAWDYIENILA